MMSYIMMPDIGWKRRAHESFLCDDIRDHVYNLSGAVEKLKGSVMTSSFVWHLQNIIKFVFNWLPPTKQGLALKHRYGLKRVGYQRSANVRRRKWRRKSSCVGIEASWAHGSKVTVHRVIRFSGSCGTNTATYMVNPGLQEVQVKPSGYANAEAETVRLTTCSVVWAGSLSCTYTRLLLKSYGNVFGNLEPKIVIALNERYRFMFKMSGWNSQAFSQNCSIWGMYFLLKYNPAC